MGRLFRKLLAVSFLTMVFALAVYALFREKYTAVVQELAQTQVLNATSDLTNDAIARQIENGNITYDRIVYFEKDLEGRITALKTNISEVNRLKTDILYIINDEILEIDSSDIAIPLGSIFLSEFFSGRGPGIPVQILSIRNADAAFASNFVEAGINQTLHQVKMLVSIDVTVLVLGTTTSFTTESEVIVAETVIIGEVPQTYFDTGGNYGSERKNQ